MAKQKYPVRIEFKKKKERGYEQTPQKTKETLRRSERVQKEEETSDRKVMKMKEKNYKKGGTVKYAKGGSVSKRADGCARQGRTKAKMVSMRGTRM